jgi:protein-disulfide isomerase
MNEPVAPVTKRNWGCTIFGWLLFLAVTAFLVLVAIKTVDYYGRLRRGEIVELPQFRTQLTVSKKSVISRSQVERSAVEIADQPTLGSENAPLTIVEFADFECPYSKDAAAVLRSVAAKYGDKVRVIYRDYPIDSIHPRAKEAAIAGECAQEQGKFWAYHDRLYQNSPALDHADLIRYARESGLDEAKFSNCLVNERYKDKVEKDAADALALGVSGTPVFFFNGQKVEGAIPAETFDAIIQRMTGAR